jgi:predicted dienelactone hydrolase
MRSARKWVAVVALAVIAPVPGWTVEPARYSPDAGPHKVLTADRFILHDSARHKDVRVKIYYPEGPGPFPVIIFSHGAFASKEAYWALGEYWASYGYVSIHPSHDDSRDDSGYRGGLMKVLNDSKLWESRPKDISFVIDSLGEIEKRVPELEGKLDRSRIGVGGHSYGAYAAEAIGGATVTMPGERTPRSFADPRVKAVVIMSPQGEGVMGLTAHSWDSMRLPTLLMYGSLDMGTQWRTPTWRSQPFYKGPPGDKYDVELKGATHFTSAGPFFKSGHQSMLFKCEKLETIAFWDAYLKDDPAAKAYLTSDALAQFSHGAARVDMK